MFERCTPETRYRRFHGPVKGIPERYLADALSGSPFHYALVAYPEAAPAREPGATRIVALASCRTVNEGAADLGVFIEDAWQRRGLGTRLIGDLAAHAAGAGLDRRPAPSLRHLPPPLDRGRRPRRNRPPRPES